MPSSFLARITQQYYAQHGANISTFTFVFPNKRAGVFFQHYLSQLLSAPIFSPEVLSITECFTSASRQQPAERLSNLFLLYDIYRDVSGSNESFDSFVFWGEMLLADFDDVDKHLIDARQLFTNVTELKEIDERYNVLSEQQIEVIKQFWRNFVPIAEGQSKKEFIATWKILYPLYERFRAALAADNITTEGMMYRDVAERLKNGLDIPEWNEKQFVFVGFNALTPCEKTLFEELQKREKADFYFDYEAAELRDTDNQSSRFYEENTKLFPSKYPVAPIVERLQDKEIELITVPSTVGQAKEIYAILNNLFPDEKLSADAINTAIVLSDENLLLPLLHSLPSQIAQVNVTMGFPLKSTPVSGLLEHILDLQRRMRVSGDTAAFYHKNVLNILRHQYISFLCESDAKAIEHWIINNNRVYIDAEELKKNDLFAAIFVPQIDARTLLTYLVAVISRLQTAWQHKQNDNEHRLTIDFLYRYYITLNRIADILKKRKGEISVKVDTMVRLTRQLLANISIPFEGEPLAGLQIMGVLETRCLDFDNLIIPSFNEGTFLQRGSQNSFIPYSLRKCFGLPVADYHDAGASYHFYRLIHRAKRIFLLYDSRTEGMQTGEVSRFMHQLHYHYGITCKRRNLSFDVSFENPAVLKVDKTPAVMEKLARFTVESEKPVALSASSLNTYIDCPLKFYLTQVEKVEQIDTVLETVEESMFGTLFHAVMENLYTPYTGKMIQPDDIKQLTDNSLIIDNEINRAFAVKYFMEKDGNEVPLEGNNLLIAHVIRKFVKQVLQRDREHAPFRYIASEGEYHLRFPICGGEKCINLKGYIDRIDEKEGKTRIIDYKTGRGNRDFKSLNEVFEHNLEKRPKFVLQTFLYALLYKEKTGVKNLEPGIFYLRDVFKKDFSTELISKPEPKVVEIVNDFDTFESMFKEKLTTCLEEIYNPDVPFTQTEESGVCKYCPYAVVCGK